MPKAKRASLAHKSELNMTPMIDVVFLLLIFFMIVSELSSLDAEEIRLAPAKSAVRSEVSDERDLVVVNIRKPESPGEPGEIRIRGRKYSPELLREFLRQAADQSIWHDTVRRISNLKVLIRADCECRYEAVQRVFDACQQNGIYRTEIAGDMEYSPPPVRKY